MCLLFQRHFKGANTGYTLDLITKAVIQGVARPILEILPYFCPINALILSSMSCYCYCTSQCFMICGVSIKSNASSSRLQYVIISRGLKTFLSIFIISRGNGPYVFLCLPLCMTYKVHYYFIHIWVHSWACSCAYAHLFCMKLHN